jgi:lipid-binding SYLF domain-containing protein
MPKDGITRAGVSTLGTVLWLALGVASAPPMAGAQDAVPATAGAQDIAPATAAAESEDPTAPAASAESEDAVSPGDSLPAQDAASQGPKNVMARRNEIDAKAKVALDDLLSQHEAARKLFDQAAGYAVFTVTKAGFFVTGASGTGVAVDKRSGRRTYMRMGSGGIGIGVGAQRYSLVILFQGQEQVDRFVRGGFNAKTTAEAAAGQAGAAASSSFVEGIAIYQLTSKGLMAQADVSGTRFWPIDELN